MREMWGGAVVNSRFPPHCAVTGPPMDFLTETALSNVVVAPTIVICIFYKPTLNGLLKAAQLDKNTYLNLLYQNIFFAVFIS